MSRKTFDKFCRTYESRKLVEENVLQYDQSKEAMTFRFNLSCFLAVYFTHFEPTSLGVI